MEVHCGSDRSRLICGCRLHGASAGVPVALEQAAAWPTDPSTQDDAGFVWLHFNLSDAAAGAWIRTNPAVRP